MLCYKPYKKPYMVHFLRNIWNTGLSHFKLTYYNDDIQGIYCVSLCLGNHDSMGISIFFDWILHEQCEHNWRS